MAWKRNRRQFEVGYMRRALTDLDGIIKQMSRELADVDYDTIVVRGSSGMLVGPVLARALDKKLFVVRKPEEYESSHSGARWIGELGERWVFVDDFTSSGRTFRAVRDSIRLALKDMNAPDSGWVYPEDGGNPVFEVLPQVELDTELVGYVQYQSVESFWTPWDAEAHPGYADAYCDDTPWYVANRAEKEAEAERRAEEAKEARQATENYSKRFAMQIASYKTALDTVLAPAELVGPTPPEVTRPARGCTEPDCIVCSEVLTPPAGSGSSGGGMYARWATVNEPIERVKVTVL